MTGPAVARFRSQGLRYAGSLAALAVAVGLTLLVVHFKLPRQVLGYAFLLVIVGTAWWGGYGPGLLTAFATLLLGPYLTQPKYTIRHPNLASAPQVILISVLISRMAGARHKLREANERLDERVKSRTAELELANRSLKEREWQLMAQAEKLSESNADLEQFAYFASHDLQEPLRMIAIYTDLLDENHGARFDEESAQYMRVVRQSVRRLETLVNDLLMYSRAIHSDAVEPGEVDAGEALLVAVTNLESVIKNAGATISKDEMPKLRASSVALIQIFQNLIGNALKYRSAEAPRISVRAVKGRDEWIFAVEDNGIGIDPIYHEQIFSPFKRLHGQQYSGSGVGLAICRRVLERIGGRIWVESKPGAGSTFYFSVPDNATEKVARSEDRSDAVTTARPI